MLSTWDTNEPTSIFRNAKSGLGKIAKEKGLSVAELVRRIIDKELDRGQNKKGEPLIAVACAGCGRTQRLRERRVVLCEGYTCGFGGHCAKKSRFVLLAVPDGCVRTSFPNAAGAFSGYNTRFATAEEIEQSQTREVLLTGRCNLHADREGIHDNWLQPSGAQENLMRQYAGCKRSSGIGPCRSSKPATVEAKRNCSASTR